MADKPICYDLYAGLGGWAEGFLAEGYEVVGFDIEAHEYWVPDNPEGDGSKGTRPIPKRGWRQGCAVSLGLEGAASRPPTKLLKYPGKLILRDVRSIHGSELKDATVIVASPPCQEYSYMAMPWSKAKAKQAAIEADETGLLRAGLTDLFNQCFRIQRETIEAAGHHIPLIVENVRGAQKWVGRARWNYGSFYLWGDVPALMPQRAYTFRSEHEGIKQPGIGGLRENGKGDAWFQNGAARNGSKSNARKAASAMIAKIPYSLAQHIARSYYPRKVEECVVHGHKSPFMDENC